MTNDDDDRLAFTPWSALAGGLLIGVAVALFASLNGRVAGISGILGGLLRPTRGGASPDFARAPSWSSWTWGASKALAFAGAMLVGMGVFELLERRRQIGAPRGVPG